ncbi:MAG TPA: PEP-CTERM sorting domain-containing protein [Fibrobacteria bacterium]|nr:PEP-CTERM sorting domain-containing protein [Fibrobacteria bacterium]
MGIPKSAILAASLSCAGTVLATPITFLEMHSQAGDYIGQGKDYLFDADDGAWSARQAYFGNPAHLNRSVEVSFTAPGFTEWWYLDFSSARLEADLALGTYQAQRFPFEPNGFAGLDVSGDGRGSNRLSGTFTVFDLSFGTNGAVDRFAAAFEQHSENRVPALIGRVSYRSDAFSETAAVPEPRVLFPIGLGMALLLGVRRRRVPAARASR